MERSVAPRIVNSTSESLRRAAPTDALSYLTAACASISASTEEPPADETDREKIQPPAKNPAPGATEAEESEPKEKLVLILEGQVTNLIGAGIKEADVTVRWKGKDGSPGDVISSTKSDKLGDFKIELPRPIHGDVVVTLSKSSFDDVVEHVHLGDDDYPPFVVGTLEGNLTLSGRVTDALNKKGVEGAAVTVKSVFKDWETVTDSSGRFSVKGMAPTDGEIVVEAAGFGRESLKLPSLETKDEVAVELKPELPSLP